MTVALCINCGSIKFGALLPCEQCGCGSTGNTGLDIAFTDHYLSEATLRGLGEVIRRLRTNTERNAVATWAFLKYISDRYPHIAFCNVPRKYHNASNSLLWKTELPEVKIEDSPRLDAVEASTPDAKYLSQIRHRQIQCPSCGHEQSFAVWSRINGSIDEWVNAFIASGRLFTNECNQCGTCEVVPFDTLYLTIDPPLAVVLRMPESQELLTIEVPSRDYFEEISPDFAFRSVSSPLELAEKIQLLADGHDDIAVEFIKLALCIQRGIDITVPMYYAATKKKLFFREIMIFQAFVKAAPEHIEYSLSSQKNELAEVMEKLKGTRTHMMSEWVRVDRPFMITMLESAGLMRRVDR